METRITCVELLGEAFGYTVNEKGYKVLNPAVRLIQGDGIDGAAVEDILMNFERNGWSADNIAFGCGAGLLQKVNRDTCKFAFKCSAIKVDGKWINVYKEPITDPGKKSKKGRITLYKQDEKYFTGIEAHGAKDALVTVFADGKVMKEWTFAEVRANSNL